MRTPARDRKLADLRARWMVETYVAMRVAKAVPESTGAMNDNARAASSHNAVSKSDEGASVSPLSPSEGTLAGSSAVDPGTITNRSDPWKLRTNSRCGN